MGRSRDNADIGHLCGMRNILRNPYFRIWQRGVQPQTDGSINVCADGWRVYGVGGTFTPYRDDTKIRGMYVPSGGPAYTTMTYTQRLEQVDCLPLVGEKLTLTLYGLRNDSPQERTIPIDILSANAPNDFSPTTLIETINIVAVANSEEDYTITFATMPESVGNGIQMNIRFCDSQLLLSGEEIGIDRAQLEIGDKATPFSYIPYDQDFNRCCRYYQGQNGGQIYSGDVTVNGNYINRITFPVQMRTTPTMTVTASSGSAAFPNGPEAVVAASDGFRSQRMATSTIHGQVYFNNWKADAEL